MADTDVSRIVAEELKAQGSALALTNKAKEEQEAAAKLVANEAEARRPEGGR